MIGEQKDLSWAFNIFTYGIKIKKAKTKNKYGARMINLIVIIQCPDNVGMM